MSYHSLFPLYISFCAAGSVLSILFTLTAPSVRKEGVQWFIQVWRGEISEFVIICIFKMLSKSPVWTEFIFQECMGGKLFTMMHWNLMIVVKLYWCILEYLQKKKKSNCVHFTTEGDKQMQTSWLLKRLRLLPFDRNVGLQKGEPVNCDEYV